MSQDVEITWNGPQASAAMKRGAIEGLKAATQLLLGEAIKIVPLDEATLQDSGKATVDEENLEGIVSFDTPYAVIQHERLDFVHLNGREAKYLEKPWRANAETFAQIIAERIRRALG
jgi:hypothetical protein